MFLILFFFVFFDHDLLIKISILTLCINDIIEEQKSNKMQTGTFLSLMLPLYSTYNKSQNRQGGSEGERERGTEK